jgi:mono/diheme cytochrome c family protein
MAAASPLLQCAVGSRDPVLAGAALMAKPKSTIRVFLGWLALASSFTIALAGSDPNSAAEKGRIALTTKGYLPAAWSSGAYNKAGRLWNPPGPDPERDSTGYPIAFRERYGLHPAPYPNNGLPMGLRTARSRDGKREGLQIDCMVCHGGSIGGASIVGLGNTQLDLRALLDDLTIADGKKLPPPLFTLNSARGTMNAGQIAIVLLSFRDANLSYRTLPLLTGASLPELDVPPWWHLAKKKTQYYDGRTDARSARSNMQFFLGDFSLQDFKDLESTFEDIQAYFRSIKPPKYPFPIDATRADKGRLVFEKTCAKCHGTYGPGGSYPNEVVPLDLIGTDPARAKGITRRFVQHYNSTWFGENEKVDEEMVGYQAPPLDGIWATAPYLHNGSVPSLALVLQSSERPARFRRPPSTDFLHYDRANVGWKYQLEPEPADPKMKAQDSRYIYDTARWGLGNRGHTFGDKLSEEQRTEVIEYLKTL